MPLAVSESPKFITFALPRTASTVIHYLFYLYAKAKWNYQANLYEYFNLQNGNDLYSDTGTSIEKMNDISKGVIVNAPAPGEFQRRFDLLIKYEAKIFGIKAMANQIPNNVLRYWNDKGFHFILIERRDLLDQILSETIANRTRVYSGKHKRSEYQPYHVELSALDCSLKRYKEVYFNRKKDIKRIYKTIYYEDFAALENKFEVLHLLGFDDWRDYVNVSDPKVEAQMRNTHIKLLTREDKLRLLVNRDEVLHWEQTRLQNGELRV